MALDPLTELMADSNRMLAPEWACKPDHSQVPWIVIQFASYIYITDAGLSKRQLRVNFLPLQCGPCCIIGSTNPCRITRKEFLMKQTKMYVCTLNDLF